MRHRASEHRHRSDDGAAGGLGVLAVVGKRVFKGDAELLRHARDNVFDDIFRIGLQAGVDVEPAPDSSVARCDFRRLSRP